MKYCHACRDVCTKRLASGGLASSRHPCVDPAALGALHADQQIVKVVEAITSLVLHQGLVCVDFGDLRQVLSGGIARFGEAERSGPDRVRRACEGAVEKVQGHSSRSGA